MQCIPSGSTGEGPRQVVVWIKIYERIGYARVGQFERVTFTPRAARPRS